MTTTVWQIAAGDNGRYYSSLFKKYDLMFLGPGDLGNILKELPAYEQMGLSSQKLGALKTFANSNECKEGDIILVREGYRVVSIGVVANDEYNWNPCLDDVYGWPLQHTRRVIYQDHLENELADLQDIAPGNLFESRKSIPMFTRVNDQSILSRISHLFSRFNLRKLKESISGIKPPMLNQSIEDALHLEGLSQNRISTLMKCIKDTNRLATWYEVNGENSARPSEHEIVCFILVPLFESLGWSKQTLGIEWNKVDLSGFTGFPSNNQNCIFACEAKKIGRGMQEVYKQAVDYVDTLGLCNVKKVITSDGVTIMIYEKDQNNQWGTNPSGYVNLLKIRRTHLIHHNTDGIKTLMNLTPEGISRRLHE